MGDPTHLEKMGRELKCPICLSLLNSAVSLSCNHLFCNSCIVKSMKSDSSCPVCKLPFRRREVRPAPQMDSLVNIYRSMEVASGIQIFVSQNAPLSKITDEEKQVGGVLDRTSQDFALTSRDHKGTLSRKKSGNKKNGGSGSMTTKPSFPSNKRVQVPQSPPSETPIRDAKLQKGPREVTSGVEQNGSNHVAKERILGNANEEHALSPFFWLREEEPGKLSQDYDEDELFDSPTPKVPSFSDIKDSDDDCPSAKDPPVEANEKLPNDLFDSEMFEWTQRPCSPELCSSPLMMQNENASEIDENRGKKLIVGSKGSKANHLSVEKIVCVNHVQESSARVLRPSVSLLETNNSEGQKGRNKSRKRTRQSKKKNQENHDERKAHSVIGINDDSHHLNVSLSNKRTSFSGNATQPTPETVPAVSAEEERLNSVDGNMVIDIPASLCKQGQAKASTLKKTGKRQKKDISSRSGKQNVIPVENSLEDPSLVQGHTTESSGPQTYVSCSQMADDEKAHFSRREEKSASENRARMSTKKANVSSDRILKDKHVKEIEFDENVQLSTVKVLNNSLVKELSSPINEKAVLQKCDSHTKKYQCAFCLSSQESEMTGEIVHYFNGKPVAADYNCEFKVVHSHRNCTEWAPNVYFDGDIAINLEVELTRSRRIKCSFCGLKGAALGCFERSCHRSFHVPCAKLTPQCRWDAENFVMLCPLHASSKLPCESSESQVKRKKSTSKGNHSATSKHVTAPKEKCLGSFKKIVLCCSALTISERDIISEFEKLTQVTVMKKWDSRVTHVIASTDGNGSCRRTLKFLLGILEGKWIVNIEWIKACMKAKEPVDEEHYEISSDIHGVQDGPHLGRLRIINQHPKLFDGYKFYFTGDFIPSYKGFLHDLVIAAGGVVLNRKPVSGDKRATESDSSSSQAFIVYCLELPEKCDPKKKDTILCRRRSNAEALATSTGFKLASNSWILNSIAAYKLQSLGE